MAGDVRPSPGYYLAIALLAVGLLAGGSLFFLLATRSQTTKALIDISSPPQHTACPAGSHAPVCYTFIVTNIGHGPLYATCELGAAPGTNATFDDGQLVKPVSLLEGQTRDLSVRVEADGSDTVREPTMSCPATAA